jgi:hypothetical protein
MIWQKETFPCSNQAAGPEIGVHFSRSEFTRSCRMLSAESEAGGMSSMVKTIPMHAKERVIQPPIRNAARSFAAPAGNGGTAAAPPPHSAASLRRLTG